MGAHADLLPGTLDVLILQSVSLGPLHGYAVLARLEQITPGALSSKGRSTPRSTGSSTRDCSTPSGARRRTTGARSITGSRLRAGSGFARKPTAGIVWRSRCRRH